MPKRHVRKKRCEGKRKDAYPKKICHMPTRHVKRKKQRRRKQNMYIAHVHENTRREIDHAKDFIHYPQKKYIYSTHLHLLIRLYDSFLLGFCF